MHVSEDKMIGGQFRNKPASWAEILALFPPHTISLHAHPVTPSSEKEWLHYLLSKAIDAELYWYADHPGKYETVEPIDASHYLKSFPLLKAEEQDTDLPDRLITVQWDSNARRRTISEDKRERVLARYRSDGYTPVIVGGDSTTKGLGWILKRIAHAMSKAELHVGVDSAFMHLAMLYLPMHRIHIYNEPDGFMSHHALRARDNGAVFNPLM